MKDFTVMKSNNIHLQKHLLSSRMSKSVSQIELCTNVFLHPGMCSTVENKASRHTECLQLSELIYIWSGIDWSGDMA